jgi:hypothetical protein
MTLLTIVVIAATQIVYWSGFYMGRRSSVGNAGSPGK